MIKTKKLFAGLLSAGLLIAASCGSDGEPAGGDGAPVAARVTASIGAAQSRASGTAWGANDRIGISGAGYNNVPYITDGNGDFSPAVTGILFQSPEVVTFKAYYPYDEFSKDIDASTSDQKNQKGFDFLFAEGAKASASSPTLSFTGDNAFRHCMTRLVLDIKADANTGFSFTDIQNGEYTIYGIKHRGMFKTSTGEAMAEAGGVTQGATDWTISATPEDNNGVRSYSMILFPQSRANLTFKADIGGQHYEAELTPALEAGYVYRYNITLKNKGLSVSGCTIQDWNDGTEFSSETEVVIPPVGDKPMEKADVGDFYFSDGTFADKETVLTPRQKAACIGMVFHKGQNEHDSSDYARALAEGFPSIPGGKAHGYVVALKDATLDYGLRWGSDAVELGLYPKDSEGKALNNKDYPDIDWSGYAYTKAIINVVGEEYFFSDSGRYYYSTAYYTVADYALKVTAPSNSSGWFFPSIGQVWSIAQQLSVLNFTEAGGENLLPVDYWSSSERYDYPNYSALCMYVQDNSILWDYKIGYKRARAILAY